jgi:hypothetical protein
MCWSWIPWKLKRDRAAAYRQLGLNSFGKRDHKTSRART